MKKIKPGWLDAINHNSEFATVQLTQGPDVFISKKNIFGS